MKASELRIGNLVNYNEGGIFKVIGIYKFGIDCEDEIETTYMEYENFKPIPLTAEWFLKLGFKKEKSDIPTFSKVFGSFIEDDYEHCLIINLDADDNLYTIVNGVKLILKYVHQLQNLYHALTLEELCK